MRTKRPCQKGRRCSCHHPTIPYSPTHHHIGKTDDDAGKQQPIRGAAQTILAAVERAPHRRAAIGHNNDLRRVVDGEGD